MEGNSVSFESNPRVKIISFTGPSGSGKTTLIEELRKRHPELNFILSYTTRTSRPTDLPGEYQHINKKTFTELVKENAFAWHITVHGHSYGTKRESIDSALRRSTPSLIITTPEATNYLHNLVQDRVASYFILPPTEKIMRERMTKRGDHPNDIERRIKECQGWVQSANRSHLNYRFITNNGTIDELVNKIDLSLLAPA